MDLSAGFLIYAALFRLAVIAVGVVAIVLGYLLFVRGAVARGRTDAGLEVAEFKLNLKNAAPGTCFAAFGAAVIVAMLVGGSPSLMMERAGRTAAPEGSTVWPGQPASLVRLKGADAVPLPQALGRQLAEAAGRLRAGDHAGAMAAYSAALEAPGLSAGQAALALEPMARVSLLRGDHEQAETLARLAVIFSAGEPAALDTLARALIAREQPRDAVAAARRATSALPDEPRYLHTLALGLAAAGEAEEAADVIEQAVRLDAVYAAERRRLLGDGP